MSLGPRVEHRQRNHRVRLEWGLDGARLHAAECAVAAADLDRDGAAPCLQDGLLR